MVLTRIDRSRNARRFYRMEIVPGLLGDWGLVREWGRIGRDGPGFAWIEESTHGGTFLFIASIL